MVLVRWVSMYRAEPGCGAGRIDFSSTDRIIRQWQWDVIPSVPCDCSLPSVR
jgi:hypothetical protein